MTTFFKKSHRLLTFLAVSVFGLTLLYSFTVVAGRINKVSLHMEAKTVEKGKLIRSQGEIFYLAGTGDMVSHFTYPIEQVVITNKFGEVKVYDPKENAVAIKQDRGFNTKGTMLYFFLSTNSQDLGLKELGFSLLDTKFEGTQMISTWQAPPEAAEALGNVTLVHEGYRPIYLGYLDPKGGILRKVFFTDYEQLLDVELPKQITEINYFNEGLDSAVTRINYSNFKLNEAANSNYFNFQIPENARVFK